MVNSLLQQAVATLSASRDPHAALVGLLALERTGALPDQSHPVSVQAALSDFAGRDPDHLNRALENLDVDALGAVALNDAIRVIRRISSATHKHLAVALTEICDELAPVHTQRAQLPALPDPKAPLQPGDWILDVSCGTGIGVLHVLDTARRAWGVERARTLTFVAVTSSPLRALATRITLAAAGCSEQAVVFCGQVLAQPILAWTNDQLQPPEFRRCIGTPPDHRSVPVTELLAADYAGALIVPARLLARRGANGHARLTARA